METNKKVTPNTNNDFAPAQNSSRKPGARPVSGFFYAVRVRSADIPAHDQLLWKGASIAFDIPLDESSRSGAGQTHELKKYSDITNLLPKGFCLIHVEEHV